MDMLGIMAKMIHHFDRYIAYCHNLEQAELCFTLHLPHDTLSSPFFFIFFMIPVLDLSTVWFGSFSLSLKYMIKNI